MANGPTNTELKHRNEKIFKRIENKLKSDDETVFLRAIQKLNAFISKPQAFYAEARPFIVHLCKTARASLTRLANSEAPFSCSWPYPEELKERVGAYASLMGTVLRHASSFENDDHLKGELKELFLSVMTVSPQSPSKDISEGSDHVALLHEKVNSWKDEKLSIQHVPLGSAPPEQNMAPSRENNLSPSTDSPMTPVPPTESSENPVGMPAPSAKPNATSKPAGKGKKIKLKKAAPVSSSLIEADLNWLSSKQSQPPGPGTSPGLLDVGGSSRSPSVPTRPEVQMPTNDGPAIQTPGKQINEPSAAAFAEDSSATSSMAGDFVTSSTQPTGQTRELEISQLHLVQPEDMIVTDAQDDNYSAPGDSGGAMVLDDSSMQNGGLRNRFGDGHSTPRPLPTLSGVTITGPTSRRGTPLQNIFDISVVKFVCSASGCEVGEQVTLQCELSPSQLHSLSLWKARDEHERDTSSSLCLSLACYSKAEAMLSIFSAREPIDENSQARLLMRLTPSWPTNSRLCADVVGSSRTFLAPPLVLTNENLTDISHHVKQSRVELHLNHAGDMQEYVFALVLHPPTPSQLQELEEERASKRKFRATLDSLRITAVDIFA